MTTKTWFITGASNGLGRLLAEQVLSRGDRVVATVRREAPLAPLVAEHGDRLLVMHLDVTDTAAIRPCFAEAFARMSRIDVIVSNAGYGLFGAAEEVDDAQIDAQIATNLVGSIQVIRAALPHLRRQGGGLVIQVSSEGGQMAYPCFSLYHATKWGIEGFVESVAQEVKPMGIDFLLVEPGPTATNFGASLVVAEAMGEYADSPAGAVRQAVGHGDFKIRGDAARTVSAMVAAADQRVSGLRRLTLGSTAYDSIHAALESRLRELQGQKDIALSADAA
jgi:NAD(P)-dependent dehydrogenase (short-subunit alcohol dehydrogenase family)